MGVRGLTTYINYNQDVFLHQFLLHDCNLLIDGHSLCAQSYRMLNCFSAFGGDYDKFAAYVKNIFKSLRKCNITPYVLFDGSYETRKLRTAYNRLRSKINGASRLDPVTQGSLQIFPLLLRDVFKEVLSEMDVSFTVCEFEADDEIAAMARHLNCPVLSYDSDFFIYNVLYIPFNTLDTKPKQLEQDGSKIYALECRLYKVEHLTDHFGGLKQEMLPLLATLLGNDFVEKRVFNKFFTQLKMPKSKKKKNEQQRCINALFNWLQNETFDSAISKILGRLKKRNKDRVFAIIKKSVAGYNRTHCESLKYFNINDNVVDLEIEIEMPIKDTDDDDTSEEDLERDIEGNEEDSEEEEIESSSESDDEECKSSLPEAIAEGIRQNYIPQSYINLYTHHLHFCSPQAEDYNDEDSFIATLPILRYAFDLLTDFSEESCTYISRESDSNYRRILVDQQYCTTRLFVDTFSDLTVDQLHLSFRHFLKEKLPLLDCGAIELLPSSFQLYMIAIVWWLANCKVSRSHLHSLFLCYIMLEVVDEKTGSFRGHNYFYNKYSKKLEQIKKLAPVISKTEDEMFLNKNKVLYEDCLIAASVLLKHFEMDDSIRKKPKSYDVKKMHCFAQFQCCLQQVNYLNILCRNPFESTKFSKGFNGTLAYNIALKLENQADPSAFLHQYLKGATTVLMFYQSLYAMYEKCTENMSLTTINISAVKRRKRGKKCQTDDDIAFIVKGFESEVII